VWLCRSRIDHHPLKAITFALCALRISVRTDHVVRTLGDFDLDAYHHGGSYVHGLLNGVGTARGNTRNASSHTRIQTHLHTGSSHRITRNWAQIGPFIAVRKTRR
jgi:hypothetical protein